jgi:ubiquitin carboxyl-terminal hydrolase 14
MEIIARKKRADVVDIKKPKYTQFEKNYFEGDIGSNNSGWYTLKAVLTHQGRSSDAGHYIAWTKQEDHWVKFDDDKVTNWEV